MTWMLLTPPGVIVFQGAAALNLDVKGRLAIPTRHRDGLLEGGQSKLVLTAHPDGCILMYPIGTWDPIRSKVLSFPSLDPQFSVWKRLLVGFAEDVELDAAGRVLVSPELRNFASMRKEVMMVGQGSHFELWDHEAWQRQLALIMANRESKLPLGLETFSL